jgi:hypothetical protein
VTFADALGITRQRISQILQGGPGPLYLESRGTRICLRECPRMELSSSKVYPSQSEITRVKCQDLWV